MSRWETQSREIIRKNLKIGRPIDKTKGVNVITRWVEFWYQLIHNFFYVQSLDLFQVQSLNVNQTHYLKTMVTENSAGKTRIIHKNFQFTTKMSKCQCFDLEKNQTAVNNHYFHSNQLFSDQIPANCQAHFSADS